MKVLFKDNGEQVEVDNYHDLIRFMRISSYDNSKSNHDFMENYAIRAVKSDNLDIRFTNEDDFVNDLIKNNLIAVEK